MSNDNKKANENLKKKEKPIEKKSSKSSKSMEDFKRKYFEYYDDIKISDRQDW